MERMAARKVRIGRRLSAGRWCSLLEKRIERMTRADCRQRCGHDGDRSRSPVVSKKFRTGQGSKRDYRRFLSEMTEWNCELLRTFVVLRDATAKAEVAEDRSRFA
jgi:hypothetical protein